ncbi:MAG: glutamate--tRNA ligase, partial [Anaerolineae bacterium]|nr:glutamate--tRNA ligase [Anaerolineae bacterium]
IRQLDQADLAERLVPFLRGAGYDVTAGALMPIVPLIQERLKTLAEVVDWTGFFFEDELDYDPTLLVGKKMTAAESLEALRRAREVLAGLDDFEAEAMEASMRALADELGVKAGPLFGILRGAVTAQQVSPPLFETMEILGRAKTLERIDGAIQVLEGQTAPAP